MSKNRVIISKIISKQITVTEASKKYGVSRRHLYRLLSRAKNEGIDAVEPRSRKPKTNPQATSQEVKTRIVSIRQQLTAAGHDAGPATIAWHLEKNNVLTPSISTIRRILHKEGLIIPEPRKRPRNSYIRFEADFPNETWQSDVTHWRLADDTVTEIINWLDDHSRFLIVCQARTRVSGGDVVNTFLEATETYGIPASTLTDNGMVYTARFVGGTNAFEYLLPLLGVTQKNGSPGHPQTQGKIERFHQTLKRYLAKQSRPKNIEMLQDQLNIFRKYYNEQRPHRACNRKTPHETYTSSPKALPNQSTEPTPFFRVRYDRIHDKGNLTLRRGGTLHHLAVGAKHAKKRIFMLIDDIDVTVVEITTGEVLSVNKIQPERNYWRNQLLPPGRWPQKKSDL